MKIWAILPAAGIGRRMGSAIPKQYLSLGGYPVIKHSLRLLSQVSEISHLSVVIHPADQMWSEINNTDLSIPVAVVMGGEERNQSVLNGLNSLPADEEDWVLVHDAVRPCVTVQEIRRLIQTLIGDAAGGLLASPIANTVKKVSEAGVVEATVDRSRLWNALTPQMFRYGLLLNAMESAVAKGLTVTDEASAMELAGHSVKIVAGSSHNIKITHEADLRLAELILSSREPDQ